MRLIVALRQLALAATLAACVTDYEGGGRRTELPSPGAGGAGGAAGQSGAGGIGLSGSSGGSGGSSGADVDGALDRTPDADDLEPCAVDAGYPLETGQACAPSFVPGTICRRDDGAECFCRADSLTWDCV